MTYVKFIKKNNRYHYLDSDTAEMCNLSDFFSSDVESFGTSIFRAWALADKTQKDTEWTWTFGGNIINLEEDDDLVLMTLDLPLEEGEEKIILKISKEQFVHLLDEWDQKVTHIRPQEVTITKMDGNFILETK